MAWFIRRDPATRLPDYRATVPLSTAKICPVTKSDAAEAKYRRRTLQIAFAADALQQREHGDGLTGLLKHEFRHLRRKDARCDGVH